MTEKIVRLETQAREGRELEVLLASPGYQKWREGRLTELLNDIQASDVTDTDLLTTAHELRAFTKLDQSLKQLVTEGNQAAKDLEKRR